MVLETSNDRNDHQRSEGYCIKVYSQNSRGLRATNLEEVLANMKIQGIFAWCLQETWRCGNSIEKHEGGYVCIHHGPKEKLSRRGSLGVSIVLNPTAYLGFKAAGSKCDYYGLRIIAITIKLKDAKGKDIFIRLISAYAPHSGCTGEEKEQYESDLSRAIISCGDNEILIVGSDTNASLSCIKETDIQDAGVQRPVGKFGCEHTNAAGERLESFMGTHNMCLPTTFFQKKKSMYSTWYHMCNKKGYQIDQFLMKRNDLKRVIDAGTAVRHSICSDHRAIYMKLRIARNLPRIAKSKPFSKGDTVLYSDTDGTQINAKILKIHNDMEYRVTILLDSDENGVQKERQTTLNRIKHANFNSGRVLRANLQDCLLRAQFVADAEAKLLELDSRLAGNPDLYNNHSPWRLKQDGKTIQETLQDALTSAAKTHLVASSRVNPGWFVANQPNLTKSCATRNDLQHSYNLNPTLVTKAKLRKHQNDHKRLIYKSKQDWVMTRVKKINGSGSAFVGHYWQAVKDLIYGSDRTEIIVPLMFRNPDTGKKCKSEKECGKVLVDHLDKLLNAVPEVEEDSIASVKQREVQDHMNAAPDKVEIFKALRRQNNNKATGDSKVPAEFYKACMDSTVLFAVLKEVLVRAWNDEEIPKEWLEGRIKMLPKDGDLLDPGRWRSITLLDAMAKIMSTILTFRLNEILKTNGLEMQNGFTPGRGTVDGSFCVRSLLKKRKEHGLVTYGYFLDLVKAFDTVPRKSLLRVLKKFGVPVKMVTMVKNMYTGCIVKVDVGENEFSISATAGVKQGDNLAPVLFLIYIQAVLQTLDDKFPDREKLSFATKFDHILHGRKYNVKKDLTLFEIGESLYADDAFFGFNTRSGIEKGALIIDRHFTSFGLQVHRGRYLMNGERKKSKTECMYFPAQGNYTDGDTTDVIVDNGFYAFTKTFKYLGSIITYDLSADADVAARIRSATGAFAKLRKTLLCKRTKLSQRSAIYVTIVMSILLFGSETWGCKENLLKKLEVFHNHCIRQMCHVNRFKQWKTEIKTTTLNKRVGLPPVREMIAARQLRWGGHVARMENHRGPKMLLTSIVQHKRPRGRPVQTFGHSLKKFLKMRANSMTEKHLDQTYDIQLDPNEEFLTRITGHEFKAALLRTTKAVKKDVLTWIDFTKDRDIWRMIVLNDFTIKPVIDEQVAMEAWTIILDQVPRRPHRTKENQRNNLPKLYAIWTGATRPLGRKVKINKVVDSWIECKPMVFKVSGAQYISATNNAAGRKHLELWLKNHTFMQMLHGNLKTLLKKNGKRYYFGGRK